MYVIKFVIFQQQKNPVKICRTHQFKEIIQFYDNTTLFFFLFFFMDYSFICIDQKSILEL